MKNPLVSVIMPCYNYGKYINEALQSVLNSTYKNIEIIVVDDGSTDEETLRVLNRIKNRRGIKVIRQQNQGPAVARNTAINNSHGNYILPLDADDKIHNEFIKRAVAVLETNQEIGFVYSHVKVFGDEECIWYAAELNLARLIYENHIPISSMYRRRCWEEAGGYNSNTIEDWDFWINIAKRGWKGYLIREPLFYHRKHGESRYTYDLKRWETVIKNLRLNHKELYKRIDLWLQWILYRTLKKLRSLMKFLKSRIFRK